MTDEEMRREIFGGNARTPAEQAAFNAGYAMGMTEGQRIGRNNATRRALVLVGSSVLVAWALGLIVIYLAL